MSRRASIAEVKPVTLGESGKEQQIPVLETLTDGSHQPGKTTVAAMAEYLQAGGAGNTNRIQRFFLKSTQVHTLSTTINQLIGRSGVATRLQFEKQAASTIAGPAEAFTLVNDNIRVSAIGFYRITLNITAQWDAPENQLAVPGLDAEKGSLRIENGMIEGDPFVEFDGTFDLERDIIIPNLTITPLDRITNYYGVRQPNTFNAGTIVTTMFSQQIIYQAKNLDPLEFLASMYNGGTARLNALRTWTLIGGNSPIASNIIIEQL